MIDVTREMEQHIRESSVSDGICHVFIPHTTAAVTINEGADPDVQKDILNGLDRMVPDLDYKHLEGNSRSHIMTSLIGSSVTITICNGCLQLGTWQKVFFCEFDGPRQRKIQITGISA